MMRLGLDRQAQGNKLILATTIHRLPVTPRLVPPIDCLVFDFDDRADLRAMRPRHLLPIAYT